MSLITGVISTVRLLNQQELVRDYANYSSKPLASVLFENEDDAKKVAIILRIALSLVSEALNPDPKAYEISQLGLSVSVIPPAYQRKASRHPFIEHLTPYPNNKLGLDFLQALQRATLLFTVTFSSPWTQVDSATVAEMIAKLHESHHEGTFVDVYEANPRAAVFSREVTVLEPHAHEIINLFSLMDRNRGQLEKKERVVTAFFNRKFYLLGPINAAVQRIDQFVNEMKTSGGNFSAYPLVEDGEEEYPLDQVHAIRHPSHLLPFSEKFVAFTADSTFMYIDDFLALPDDRNIKFAYISECSGSSSDSTPQYTLDPITPEGDSGTLHRRLSLHDMKTTLYMRIASDLERAQIHQLVIENQAKLPWFINTEDLLKGSRFNENRN